MSKSVINTHNRDSRCFLWALYSHFYFVQFSRPAQNFAELKQFSKQSQQDFNCTQVDFPITINQIEVFANLNNLQIRVYHLIKNVFSQVLLTSDCGAKSTGNASTNCTYILTKIFQSKKKNTANYINLLLYKEHYSYIQDIAKLLNALSFINNEKSKLFACENCGNSIFKTSTALSNHKIRCLSESSNDIQMYSLPVSTDFNFSNWAHKLQVPFKIFADFESYFINQKTSASFPPQQEGNSDESKEKINEMDTANTIFLQEHKMMAYGFQVSCKSYPEIQQTHFNNISIKSITDVQNGLHHKPIEDSFISDLILNLKTIDNLLSRNKPLAWTQQDQIFYTLATDCFFCDLPLGKDKVADHDHITGKFRCAAHNLCNFKHSKQVNFIPVFFHNLAGKINLIYFRYAKALFNLYSF